MLTLKSFSHCFYKAAYNTVHHDGIEHAGYLAFLALLAMFPFLVFLVALAGFLTHGQLGADFVAQVFSHLPPRVVAALEPRVHEIISGPPQGLLTVAILGAIWTSSSAVEGYRTVLNRAYHVNTPPSYLWRRLLSIGQLLVFTFIVIIGMALLVLLPIVWHKLVFLLDIPDLTDAHLSLGNFLVILTLFSLFAAVANVYYILPNIRQSWRAVIPGAAVTVLLWMGAASLFTAYLSNFNQVNLIYGSLGGIIAALLFFYITNVIFIYGAEFNYLLMRALGGIVEQKQETEKPLPRQED